LYEGGLTVHTSLDPHLQHLATKALRDGLMAYDRRHGGWRGPLGHIALDGDWSQRLAPFAPPMDLPDWRAAVVLSVKGDKAELGFAQNAQAGLLRARGAEWAHKRRLADVVSPGDVILVSPYGPDGAEADAAEPVENAAAKSAAAREWRLDQVPEVNGATVVMDPHTGRVLAMIGGFSMDRSEFNRATQALRQPGSAFKPFVYAAALDSGFTPSTIVMDSPLSIDVGGQLGVWRPENYGDTYLGPQTLRQGLEKSRNVMTVRIAQRVGMAKIVDYAKRFGIDPNMPRELAMALGAGETTVLRLTTAYAMLVNGGKRIAPSLIDRIQDRRGHTIYRRDQRPCPDCQGPWHGQEPPALPDPRDEVIDPRTAYQVVSLLEGVVQRGTGKAARAIGRPVAGKTGTSNDSKDTWFVGFSPDLVAGVFVGFDQPRSLGKHETGGSVAAPIFTEFMTPALADKPPIPFRMPPGLRFV
jgi:penicillin-binding protein 1A